MFVVTGIPNYPTGEIYEEYKGKKRRDEIIDGVKIHRCLTISRKTGPFFRALNYYSFAFFSTRYIRRLKEEFDVVFINQLSPVLMAKAGIVYGRRHKKPTVLYCLDIWPESLIEGGFSRRSFVYKYIHRISRIIYRRVDKILVTSPGFSDYFEHEFGIKDTMYLPQYAEDFYTPDSCRKVPNGEIHLMFAGNIGTAQGVHTLIKAVRLLDDIKNLYLHIVGAGSELERIKDMAKDMPNVIFHGIRPAGEMPAYFSLADACVVTLKSGALSSTLPGKVQAYLAAGKPIIASADGITRDTINAAGCGYCSPADDVSALASNIRKFITAEKDSLSKNAREYYEKNFSKQTFIEKLEKALEGK